METLLGDCEDEKSLELSISSRKYRACKNASESSATGVLEAPDRKQQPRETVIVEAKKSEADKSIDELAELCKPLVVNLTRLPETAANKIATTKAKMSPVKKMRRFQCWKYGVCAYRRNRARRKKLKFLRLQMLREADDINESSSETVKDPESVVFVGPPSVRGEAETMDTGAFGVEEPTQKQTEKIEGTLEPDEIDLIATIAENAVVSQPTISYGVVMEPPALRADPSRDSDKESETTLITQPDASHGVAPAMEECPENAVTTVEEGSNLSRDETLPPLDEPKSTMAANQQTFKEARKRKITWVSESDETNEQHSPPNGSKKPRRSSLPMHDEGVSVAETPVPVSTSGSCDERPASQAPEEPQKDYAESVDRGKETNRIRLLKEAVVFLTRLHNLRSPLIEKWKKRTASSQSPWESTSERSPNENHVENVNADLPVGDDLSVSAEGCPTSVTSEPVTRRPDNSTDTVMCVSYEHDNDKDDNEIVAFLSAHHEAKQTCDRSHTEDEASEDQPHARAPTAQQTNSELPPTDGSLLVQPLKRKRTRPPRRVRSSSSVDYDDPEYQDPDSLKFDKSLKKKGHCNQFARIPLTRSRSRAAQVNSQTMASPSGNEMPPSSEQTLPDRVSTCNSDSLREMIANAGTGANGIPVSEYGTEKVREVVDPEADNREVASFAPDAANVTAGPIDTRDERHEDHAARKTLSAMKNAMVMLTRLEELDNSPDRRAYIGDEFNPGYGMNFSTNFCLETVKDDVPFSFEFESNPNEPQMSYRNTDPLEIDRNIVGQSRVAGGNNNQSTDKDVQNGAFLQIALSLAPSTSQLSENDVRREYGESGDYGRLTVGGRTSKGTRESDITLSLILGKTVQTPGERPGRELSQGTSIVSNFINDRVAISQNLAGQGERGDCDEHCRDNARPESNKNVAAPGPVPVSMNGRDMDPSEHRKVTSAFSDARFRCCVCQACFSTLVELAIHRGLDKCPPGEQPTMAGTSSEPRSALSNVTTPSKDNEKSAQQNTPRKPRTRVRCHVDNLKCNVCSVSFPTKSALSEHLYKHSSKELQEAFRIAKARAIAAAQAENEARMKSLTTSNDSPGNTNGNRNVRGDKDQAHISAERAFTIGSNVAASAPIALADSSTSTLATVCLCHRDIDRTFINKTDLQIEMVLLCKYCHVLFRRRECLEIHYRTSLNCAIDRTRERWPRLFCANCQLSLQNWADMRQHLEVHARQNAACAIRFVCNICRVVFVGFGTLFYNHWVSHSKDSMFVAGRYNFPKFSVQPIDGTEKLPAGASPDEDYIFVAEHVCTTCKKPFSMRRDLELHQMNKACERVQRPSESSDKQIRSCDNSVQSSPPNETTRPGNQLIESSSTLSSSVGTAEGISRTALWCDVCCVLFTNEQEISDHAARVHYKHYVYTVVGAPAKDRTFKCTKCDAFFSSIRAIEEHWRLSLHMQPKEISTDKPLCPMSSLGEKVPNDRLTDPASIPTNRVALRGKNETAVEPPLIIIGEDDAGEKDCPTATNANVSSNRSLSAEAQKTATPVTPSTSTESGAINVTGQQVARTRALEDSRVNVVVSDRRGVNMSASLVVEDARKKSMNGTIEATTDRYRILLTDPSSAGRAITTQSSKTTTNSAALTVPPAKIQSYTGDSTSKDKGTAPKSSDAKSTGKPTSTINLRELLSSATINSATPAIDRPYVPEVIVIVDDNSQDKPSVEATVEGNASVARKNQQNFDVSSTANKEIGNSSREIMKSSATESSTGANGKSVDAVQLRAIAAKRASPERCSSSEASSATGRNVSAVSVRSRTNVAALRAAKASYEEERWNWLRSTSTISSCDTNGAKKQGFLRVKDLSELQAVRTPICCTCNRIFQSDAELTEHNRLRMCGNGFSRKPVERSTGIAAALVLPDSSGSRKTPTGSSTAHTSNNNSGTPLDIDATQLQPHPPERVLPQVQTNQLQNTAASSEPVDPWIRVGSRNPTVISYTGRTGLLAPDTQPVPSGLSHMKAHRRRTSRRSSGRIHNNISSQQPSQQLPVSSLGVAETSQRLSDNRTAAPGYHGLPPMVVLPTTQTSKHRSTATGRRTSSNTYLPNFCLNDSPLTYQPDKPNQFLCNICRTFECYDIDTFNSHVTRHYKDWKSSDSANALESSSAATTSATATTTSSVDINGETTQPPSSKTTDANDSGNLLMLKNWMVKDTPQGPVLVTPNHPHACPSCRCVFSNIHTLHRHLELCRLSLPTDGDTYGNC